MLDEATSVETGLPLHQVRTALELLAGGNTIPFIARYRKEATGGLDEVQLRAIEEVHAQKTELEQRRETILKSLDEQGISDRKLLDAIRRCGSRAELEDLYLPFRPKRKTRASVARERGLAPLAQLIRAQPRDQAALARVEEFISPDREVPDRDSALGGAKDIIAEEVSEDSGIRKGVRDNMSRTGVLEARKARGAEDEGGKYQQYLDFSQPVSQVPSHRYLAVTRGEREKVLKVSVEVVREPLVERTCRNLAWDPRSVFASELKDAVDDGFKRLLLPSIEKEVRQDLKARSDETAVAIFADNLKKLLLAAPFGARPVVGIDPGFRTGCKCAAVDRSGAFAGYLTIYPHSGARGREQAERDLLAFLMKHRPDAVGVGNGTAGRETLALVRDVVKKGNLTCIPVSVNESGASVYSASELAAKEFPDLDLTIRGAISIGRRVQDPLAELVKVEPRSLGVGQYQHDVSQSLLEKKLAEVVEDAVNLVGVELNTASVALLTHVAGIGPALAKAIVNFREQSGPFRSRKELLKVPRLGPRVFEQAAGFLRVRDGRNPLDRSAVHPERYALVEQMAGDLGCPVEKLVENQELVGRIQLSRYMKDGVGEPTLRDIVAELARPGRDPREDFRAPEFLDHINSLEDLKVGMVLEGVVTNLTAFGLFVDIGVHQDGLVHVSRLADRFVKDPGEIGGPGDRLKVVVLDVDLARKRISLSARPSDMQG